MKPLFAIILLAGATSAQASNVILAATGLPSTYENGNYGSSDATYNGFVTATINGIPNQLILCDDAAHTTVVQSGNMVYDFSSLGGAHQLQNARFTGPNMVANYDEAAALLWELATYPDIYGVQPSANTITDYQYALWNIFDPYNSVTNPNGVKVNSNQLALQTAAVNIVDTEGAMLAADVYPNVEIYTPDPNGGSTGDQEFLQYAPEPTSISLMLGALLIGASAIARRKVLNRRA